jgi:hypothetical protein
VSSLANCGWIEPDGTWHLCAHHEHDQLAERLGHDVKVIELSWLRVSRSAIWSLGGEPTEAQIERLGVLAASGVLTDYQIKHAMF